MPYFDVSDGRIFYETHDGGDPPLVFVHGLGCAHEDWRPQVDAFAPSHRLVLPDLRGHGRSKTFASGFDIETYAADVMALAKALDLAPAVLVGHSMGCRVVLECARTCPERAAGVVLVDGSRLAEGSAGQAHRATRTAMAEAGADAFVARLFSQMFTPESDPALRDRIMARAAGLSTMVVETLAPTMAAWDAAHVEEALGGLQVPLLVVQSTYLNTQRERVCLEPGETIPWLELVRARVPEAHIEIVPGVGHFTMIEAAERVNGSIGALLDAAR